MVNDIKNKHAGVWILVVAGLILESISCLQYFTSRVSIRHEAEQRARTELRKAELEIEKHTINKKRSPVSGGTLVGGCQPRLTLVGGIVLLSADVPEVGRHGLFAGGGVFLGDEVQLVLGDLIQILPAGCYHRTHLGETLADSQFLGGGLGRTLYGCTHVQTVAVLALCSRYAVCS